MDKRILLIASVVTLIGLIIGVVLGYYITLSLQTNNIQDFQNQINNLQNQLTQKNSQIQALQDQINELESQLGPIRKGAWNLVQTFQGSSEITTDYFYINGSELRINWTWISEFEEYAVFGFGIDKEDTGIVDSFGNLEKEGTTFVHNIEVARYYLEIIAGNIDLWTITVEVWIPK